MLTPRNREMGSICADSEGMAHSNLRRFLRSVTPAVQTHTVPKPTCYDEETTGSECFYLADLWNQYYEWSACGAGTPVLLPSGETVVQYFVPYLSAIQLYTNTRYHSYNRSLNWHNDCNGYDYGYNGYSAADNWSNQNGYQTAPMTWNTVDDNSSFNNWQLYLQYFELASPYERIPLVDKVYELSYNFPGLASLRNVELSRCSWMSIFWYPIYHIPTVKNHEMSTCFLTYHRLSTAEDSTPQNREDALHHRVSPTPFGLSTLKMEGNIWANAETGDQELTGSLFSAAQSWLNKLGLQHQHHDFGYFRTHPNSSNQTDKSHTAVPLHPSSTLDELGSD